MLHSSNGHYPFGEAVWIVAGIIMLMAFGDVVIVLALVIAAAVTATWWIHRKAEHRVERDDAMLAPVRQLHAQLAPKHDLRGPRAA